MTALLRDLASRVNDENPFLGDADARHLRARLHAMTRDTPPLERLEVLFRLGHAELMLGNEDRAIDRFRESYELASGMTRFGPQALAEFQFWLGVAYMRLGETRNCCQRNNPDSCILPIRGGGVHSDPEGSTQAIECFRKVLELSSPTELDRAARPRQADRGPDPEASSAYMDALWLLNLTYMTLGRYPDDVPPEYLIPPTAFDSEESIPRFENVASRVGLDAFTLAGGAIVDDFDDDGNLDLVVSSSDVAAQIRFWARERDGSFTDRTEDAGLLGILGGLNLVQADYDNDGYLDFLVLRGAWLDQGDQHPNSLIHNNGDGTFTDVTFEAGLGEVHHPTQTGSWADYDNDGDLDLFIGNESDSTRHPCQLFRNDGDGTFTDVASQAGVSEGGFAKAVVWGDYDGDRLPDLYVSDLLGPNRLYHNNGDGTFEDVAQRLGVDEPVRSFGSWFWDFNNDGNLDLFVSSYSASIGHLAASYRDGFFLPDHLARLYRGDGHGGFVDVARRSNLLRPTAPMGSNFGDLDNDGNLDMYLGTGYQPYSQLMPNVMYLNRGGDRFVDVSSAGGFGHLQKGHAIVFADLDNDGDQDVFEQMGGFFPGDRYNDALFENPGFGNHWITIRLVGVQSNRSGIGARIRVVVRERERTRSIYKHVNSGGTFGANPLRQTIGLGAADGIERVEIYWPSTDRTQTLTEVAMDRAIEIVEGEDGYNALTLERCRLGG